MTEVRLRIPLRWRDMDMLGHLNQSAYHELLEEVRGAVFGEALQEGFPFVLARVELDYRREVRREDGHVDVVGRVTRVGTKSVTIEHEVLHPSGAVAAEGSSVLVAWDPAARGAREITDDERAALEPTSA